MAVWRRSEGEQTLLFTPGSSLAHRANPVTKLVALVWTISAASIVPLAGTVGLTIAGIAFACVVGVGRPVMKRLLITLTPLALALFVVHGLLLPSADDVAYGPIHASPSGFAAGATILMRIGAILTASLLFVTTTHPSDMMKSLDQRGVPQGLSYVLASPLLLLEPISLRAKNIRDAQRARGLDLNGNWTARLLALPALVTPLITLALTDLDHRALVLNGRAFRARPRRTVLDPPPDSDAQRWFRRIVLIVAVLQIGLVRVWR